MHTIIRDDYTPQLNEYHEIILVDPTRKKTWLFDCDGVFTDITKINVVSERGDSEEYAASQEWLTRELEALEAADQALQDNIDAEETARIAADETLQDNIDAEEAGRIAADTEIWDEIETLEAASDVVDIVGTKAELDDYDTSTLTNEDIIKVLQDETKEDATTYYRWDKTNNTFTYVGEEGPYYTQTQVDTMLGGKQDKLIAGSNIQIAADGKTISATDTTYSDFTGTDGTAAGAAGLVPAPATTDAGKYLKADGTWAAISIPTVTLYSGTGQNTDGAMTQKATTDMVFKAGDVGSFGTRIAIGNNAGTAFRTISIGSLNIVNGGDDSIVIGNNAQVSAGRATAIGDGAYVLSGGGRSVALGPQAQTSALDSVAIGYNSHADASNTVSVGVTEEESVSYGFTLYRRITAVADGIHAHDAVNKSQLDAVVSTIPATNNINSSDWSALWQ